MSEKILLPFADLLGSKCIEKRQHYIILNDESFRWVYEAWVNYRDEVESPVWHERLLSYDWTYSKSKIGSIGLTFVEEPEYWKISMEIEGVSDELKVYFKKEANARELLNTLLKYRFPDSIPPDDT